MTCLGRNQEKICCYVHGNPCRYLEENSEPGYRWTCQLRRELGDWDKVIKDPRYQNHIAGSWAPGINCRDWPEGPEQYRGCNLCGSAM